jgi:hypothetical protein
MLTFCILVALATGILFGEVKNYAKNKLESRDYKKKIIINFVI